MEKQLSFADRATMNVKEASAFAGIGINRLRRIINETDSGSWFFKTGNRTIIKKKEFLEFISKLDQI